MLKKRTAPQLYYGDLPESQDHAHQLVGHALDIMNHYVDCFESALELHDHGQWKFLTTKKKNARIFRHWQFIAARDGALSVYHFHWALQGLVSALNDCSYLAERLDLKTFRAARRRFEGWFPNAIQLRHAVGHSAEKTKNRREHLEHGFTGICKIPGLNLGRVRNYVITDHLYRRTFCNTWKGKIECYKINGENLERLALTRNAVFDAFDDMNRDFKNKRRAPDQE
jgi:hypothetical protein